MTLYEKLKKANKDNFILKNVDLKTTQELIELEMKGKIKTKFMGDDIEVEMLKLIEPVKKKELYIKNVCKSGRSGNIRRIEGFKTKMSEDELYEIIKYLKRGMTIKETANAVRKSYQTIQRIRSFFISKTHLGDKNGTGK